MPTAEKTRRMPEKPPLSAVAHAHPQKATGTEGFCTSANNADCTETSVFDASI
jgi:hypothetical protein